MPVVGLTVLEAAFVRAFLTGRPGVRGNATQAAIAAGYSPRSARRQASDLWTRPHVQAAIAARLQRAELRADEILAEIRAVALSRLNRVGSWGPDGVTLIPSDSLEDADIAAIAEVTDHTRSRVEGEGTTILDRQVRVKLHDKVEALRLAAKVLGLLKDKVELEVPSLLPSGFFAAVVTGDLSKLPPAFREPPPSADGERMGGPEPPR